MRSLPTSANPSTPDGFALTGPSVKLDPRTHAIRSDLADIRLAGRVFASHFAAPIPYRLGRATSLRLARDGGEAIAELVVGDVFEVLESAGDHAWGCAPAHDLVGYIDRAALGDLA